MRLSVCIYTYNHEAYIEKAVKSALDQDVDFDYEIIVGEDSSTDLTADILRRLEANHPGRLKVAYREANLGAEKNFARTIAECRGEYISFLDGDDFWTSRNKLALQVGFLDRHRGASFCFHRTRSLNAADPSAEYILPADDPPELSSIDFLLQESNPVALHTVVARRACLWGFSTWLANLKLGDWPLCLMLATKGAVGFLPMEMSRHRVHVGGTWTRLGPHLRVVYVIQMLNHLSGLLTGEGRIAADRRRTELTNWWAHEVICDPELPLDALMKEIARLRDDDLSTYLLAGVAGTAVRIQQARVWHEGQSQALEAASMQANEKVEKLNSQIFELSGRPEVIYGARIRRWLAGLRHRCVQGLKNWNPWQRAHGNQQPRPRSAPKNGGG